MKIIMLPLVIVFLTLNFVSGQNHLRPIDNNGVNFNMRVGSSNDATVAEAILIVNPTNKLDFGIGYGNSIPKRGSLTSHIITPFIEFMPFRQGLNSPISLDFGIAYGFGSTQNKSFELFTIYSRIFHQISITNKFALVPGIGVDNQSSQGDPGLRFDGPSLFVSFSNTLLFNKFWITPTLTFAEEDYSAFSVALGIAF